MTKYTTATMQYTFKATVQCEGCDQVFETAAFATSKGTTASGAFASAEKDSARASSRAQDALQAKLNQIQRGQLRDLQCNTPCPHCGYIQSWMVRENRRQRQEKAKLSKWLVVVLTIIAVPVCLFGGIYLVANSSHGQDVSWVCCPVAVASAVTVFIPGLCRKAYFNMIYHPNQEWLKARGLGRNQAPSPRAPTALVPMMPASPR